MTAPAIVGEACNHPGAYRVHMNVSHQLLQVAVFLHEDGAITSLEQVSRPTFAQIDSPCVVAGEVGHKASQWFRTGLYGHMDVIRHPAIGMQTMFVAAEALFLWCFRESTGGSDTCLTRVPASG